MLRLLAVVALLFLSDSLIRRWFAICLLALCFCGSIAHAEGDDARRYLAEIELHTEAELFAALQRSQALFDSGTLALHSDQPVRLVLHGPEVFVLLLQNYQQHKQTVDLAAQLSAFGVVDVKVCETWMRGAKVNAAELPPFIGTVPFGPAEEKRLLDEEGYIWF
ncbi:hypothetical protein EYC98_20865 [Halieaceae bacterium IMCC14734]|uniref:Acyl-CoA transferase n=1 Tax=Candidatus Litorirhabdus singularis TaxID=2518993 RepID=A0ABT3TLW3_9GAMM|nr:DsrE family protein [Candidatus Litorirhabdus singularis]MCX2983319.1 hypothetical protein [Candidatus Litorirhabdus singularis]